MSPQYISKRQASEEIDRLVLLNAELLAALKKIVDLAHYPDESIARAAIAKANDGGING